jgi:uroporphyrinogen-III decarboxylase
MSAQFEESRETIGRNCRISGNVPASFMVTGEPKAVKDYCRKLMDVCAPDGGFVLSGGARVDQGNPDNLCAMMEATKEFGTH